MSNCSGQLNRAHLTWLEYALVTQADKTKRCKLDNGNMPQEPTLSEAEKADTQAFLQEVLQILPLVGLRMFEVPRAVELSETAATIDDCEGQRDMVVVPAQPENFKRLFLGEDCWHSIKISGGMIDRIKYIAGYQTSPVSAVTHYAPVSRIEPYGDGSKYKLIFAEKATSVPSIIEFGDAPPAIMMGPCYARFSRLKTAKKLTDLLGK